MTAARLIVVKILPGLVLNQNELLKAARYIGELKVGNKMEIKSCQESFQLLKKAQN